MGRAKIVGSVKKFLQEHDFDGIDFDWEFPGYNRTDGAGIPKFASKWTYDPEHDRDNFMALLAETRTMLGDLQKEKSRSDTVKTWETGSVSFWHQEWLATQPGWETKYDAVADQHYLWNESESIFMSYDNVDSIKK